MPEKYREEIEEILRMAGEASARDPSKASERPPEDQPERPRLSRRVPAPNYRPRMRLPTITPGKMMLAGVVLFLIGLQFWYFIWIGLAMLVGAYLLYFITPRAISVEKRWRGRPVGDDGPSSSWERLKHWLKR